MKPELCAGCTLQKSGAGFTAVEIGARYAQTKLLLIGEASGEAEARESLPFRPYAQSGSLLADAMREVNLSRADVAITNILRCFISPRTAVLTDAGYRPISRIIIGDRVLTHRGRYMPVTAQVRGTGSVAYVSVTIGGGDKTRPTVHRVTRDHRYLMEDGSWELASNLSAGMCVMGMAETCIVCGKLFHRHFSHYQSSEAFCSTLCHNWFCVQRGKEKVRQAMIDSYKSSARDRFAITHAANAAMRKLVELGRWEHEITPAGKLSHRLRSAVARQVIGCAEGMPWVGFGESAILDTITSLGHEATPQFALEGFNYDFKVGNLLIEVDGPGSRNVVRRCRDDEKEQIAVDHGFQVVHIPCGKPDMVIDVLDNDSHNYAFIPVAVKSIDHGVWPNGFYSLTVKEDESYVAQGFVHHNCRPPRDWLEGAPWQHNAIYNCCKNYLGKVIQDLQPRAILALGGTAYRALVDAPKGKYGTLDYARGYVNRGNGLAMGIPVIATYHPAFLRRGASHLTPLLERDLRHAFQLATGRLIEGKHYALNLSALGLNYQTAPTIDNAREYAENLDPLLPLAFDIETPLSTRSDEDDRTSFADRDIKLFQCTQQRGSGIALPFRDEYVSVIRRVIQRSSLRVGFNNWNFDDPVLAANGIDVGQTDDAMVMFGVYWSELPKNLQTAAQMCGFPFPWKFMNESDLAFYGVADADATLAVYDYMTALLAKEQI